MANSIIEEINLTGYLELNDLDIKEIITSLEDGYGERYKLDKNSIYPGKKAEGFYKTLSTEFGLKPFPFHTDGAHRLIPPHWVILEYIGKENSDSATLVADTVPLQENPNYEDFFFNNQSLDFHT